MADYNFFFHIFSCQNGTCLKKKKISIQYSLWKLSTHIKAVYYATQLT